MRWQGGRLESRPTRSEARPSEGRSASEKRARGPAGRAAWLACAAALAGPAAGADPPLCLAEAAFEPAEAVVGQQVIYRVRILSLAAVDAIEWVEPLAFPGFRSEWLPGRPQAEPVARGGATYRSREESRALFPERAGRLRVPPARLRCEIRAGQGQSGDAELAAAELRVSELPAKGRPADFSGLVGPLFLHRVVEPQSLALGESVHVAVMLRGVGNLWDAPDPLPPDAAPPHTDVFRRLPELQSDAGDRLFLRRHFSYDLVPRESGTLRVPEIRIEFFDPETSSYQVAAAPAVRVSVTERAGAPPRTPPIAVRRGAPRAGGSGGPGELGWWWRVLPLALVALIGYAIQRRTRRPAGASDALERAREARRAGDRGAEAAALARALREALARHVPDALDASPEALLARPDLTPDAAAAARALAAVERARFDPSAALPDGDEVDRAISSL